ncbi:MAG TPA: hypothetical protein VFY06_13035 [Verrucomicrobiae bacterium]|nr:hypothetical protein [Verrucomicrobiae bacterium]
MPHVENADARSKSLLRWAFVICVVCVAIFQFSENTTDPDLWGHVLYGEHLLQTGRLMRTDPYSWTASGHPWINHEILAEAAMAAAYRALGGTGLLLLKMAAGLATFFVALSIAARKRNEGARLVAWAFGALAVVEMSFGFAARPQIFTALVLALEFWILRRVHDGKKAWALALPPLFVVWINTHGGVLAGLVLLFAATCASTGQSFSKQFAPKFIRQRLEDGPPPSTLLWLWFSFILSGLAMLANPYGFGLIRWLVGSVLWLRPQISEWNPTPLDWNHAAFFICVIFSMAAIFLSRKRWQLWEMAMVVALAALAVRSIRNTPLFCIAALAFVPPHLADVLDRFRDRFGGLMEFCRCPTRQKVLAVLLLLASLGSIGATFTLHKDHSWTMEVPREQYPVAAVDFIRQHDLQGNLLVFFDWGEMCLWELPGSRVSIDGRLDTCYPKDVIAAHWNFYNDKPFDHSALDLNHADYALLPSHLSGSLALAKTGGWHPVYYDNLAVVLVKNLNQFPKLAGLKLPVQGNAAATEGRSPFPDHLPTARTE